MSGGRGGRDASVRIENAIWTLSSSAAEGPQVWTIEGGRAPNFGTTKRRAFSTNAQSRFTMGVLDGVLGPLRLAQHT